MKTVTDLLQTGTARRSGIEIKGVKFLVIHDTGGNGTAKNNADYYKKSANDNQASAHAFVDDIEWRIVIPYTEKAWHVRYSVDTDNKLFGCDANDYALGIEFCSTDTGSFDNKNAYKNLVQGVSGLCKTYGLTPKKHLVQHSKLDPTRRTDPEHAFNRFGMTWERFIADVTSMVETGGVIKEEEKPLYASFGERGAHVLSLQNDLKKLGYFTADATGYYGMVTKKAVYDLQVDAEIKPHNFGMRAGEKTLAMIKELLEASK